MYVYNFLLSLALSIYVHSIYIYICIHMYIVPANDVPSACIFKRDPRVAEFSATFAGSLDE